MGYLLEGFWVALILFSIGAVIYAAVTESARRKKAYQQNMAAMQQDLPAEQSLEQEAMDNLDDFGNAPQEEIDFDFNKR